MAAYEDQEGNVPNLATPRFDEELQPEFIPKIPEILPILKMYSIQIGSKCYTISGASLSSDSPSYFTNYFSKPENEDKTLFIDRSPAVFDKIILHLQGYFMEVKTPMDFVMLFSDAFYYNLPRLKEILYKSDIFVKIGEKSFLFSKKLINSKGNYPNFFSVAYSTIFRDPTSLISNLDLIRPPPQAPIVLVDRCHKLFEIILNYLQGYEVAIESDLMRQKLTKECRYYRFLELEQRLIKHYIRINPLTLKEEITIGLRDLKVKGLLVGEEQSTSSPFAGNSTDLATRVSNLFDYSFLEYSRPYIDANIFRELIIQLDSSETIMIIHKNNLIQNHQENQDEFNFCVKIVNETAENFRNLFHKFISIPELQHFFKIQNHENSAIKSSLYIPVEIEDYTHMIINDSDVKIDWFKAVFCKQSGSGDIPVSLLKSQWKVQIKSNGFKLVAIKLDGITSHNEWNKRGKFL